MIKQSNKKGYQPTDSLMPLWFKCGQRTIIFILAAVGLTLPLFSVWYSKTASRSDCDGTFDITDMSNSMGISTVAKSL